MSDTIALASPAGRHPQPLADFSAGPRMLLVAAMALVVGSLATAAATHRGYPVIGSSGHYAGLVTRADALRWQADGTLLDGTLSDSLPETPPAVAPGYVISHVLDLMIATGAGLIPVVEPRTRALEGVISRKDLLAVRRTAGISERERARFFARQRRKRAGTLSGAAASVGPSVDTPRTVSPPLRNTMMRRDLRSFVPERGTVSARERIRTAMGGLLGILATGLLSRVWLGEGATLPVLIAADGRLGGAALRGAYQPAGPALVDHRRQSCCCHGGGHGGCGHSRSDRGSGCRRGLRNLADDGVTLRPLAERRRRSDGRSRRPGGHPARL